MCFKAGFKNRDSARRLNTNFTSTLSPKKERVGYYPSISLSSSTVLYHILCSKTWLTRKEVRPDDDTSARSNPPHGNLLCSQKAAAVTWASRQTLWPPVMECWRMTSRRKPCEIHWWQKEGRPGSPRPRNQEVREEGVRASHSDHYWGSGEEASSQVQHNREVVGLWWVFEAPA